VASVPPRDQDARSTITGAAATSPDISLSSGRRAGLTFSGIAVSGPPEVACPRRHAACIVAVNRGEFQAESIRNSWGVRRVSDLRVLTRSGIGVSSGRLKSKRRLLVSSWWAQEDSNLRPSGYEPDSLNPCTT
jgi:hypothetical protein